MPKKILIVDDNALILELMGVILDAYGYEVITFSTGTGVVNEININHPDLVILDAWLPGMDGRDICKLLKQNKATEHLPVIICSASDDLHKAMYQDGAPNDILPKPFDMNDLLKKVNFQLAA
ncbi:response regulator [Inquilinus sp. KBS0705]|nr:response regulator [Inquilinus sp. KBS0705]